MVSYHGGIGVKNKPFSYRAEYNADDNILYEGWAAPGSAESSDVWQLCQHTWSGGNLTATKWAQGSGGFNYQWAKRKDGSYTYS